MTRPKGRLAPPALRALRALRALLLAPLVALSACAVGPDFKRPAAPTAQDYGSAPASGATVATDTPGGNAQRFVAGMDIPGQWWTLFESPKLTSLVERSLKANPNATAAEAALRQAHELYAAQRAGFFPTVQAGFNGTRAKNPNEALSNPTVSPSPIYNLYTAQLSVSYAPDVFGGQRRAVEAAAAQADSARYQLEATYLTLSSNVVVTAVLEAELRDEIKTSERLLALQRQLTETTRGQQRLGTASNLDLLAQQSAEAQIAATLPSLRKQLGQTRDALTALVGGLPSEEPAETFTLDDLALPADLPVSLPSQIVAQRPDVRVAQEDLHAASAQVGVSLGNMLPQLTLDGDIGSAALKLGDLFSPYTGFWSLGASLAQTLFDGGALVHRHRAAEAALDQAAAQYRAAVILACQNVADALRALQADADALAATAEADRAARATFDLAQRQHELGTISTVALVNVELGYQQAELALVQARANRYADTAALFQALGGGWWNRPQEASR
jgi:NodT family efflux transporter outer membrane factor (OMF) lipoprotein